MANELKAAFISAASTLVAAAIGAGATLGVAYFHVGAKDATRPADQQGLISTISDGHRIVDRLTDPAVPLNQVLPQKPPPLTPQSQRNTTPPAPPPVVIPQEVGKSSEILDRCSGFEPLKPVRVKVGQITDGYTTTVELKNPTDQPIGVYTKWGSAPFTLTSGGKTMTTQSNIRDEGKFTFFDGQVTPEKWDQTFGMGLQVDPNTTTTLTGQFHPGNPPTGTSADFSITLLYLLKDEAGTKVIKTRSAQCSAIPVSPEK